MTGAGARQPPRGRRAARRARRAAEDRPARPLCVLLLPRRLEDLAFRDQAEDLLGAPGAVAVEPAALSYGALGRLPGALRDRIAASQARRMALPGQPRAIVVFEPLQYPLGRSLLALHPGAELWYAGTAAGRGADLHIAAAARAALAFETVEGLGAAAHAHNQPLFERMEALGIESGRLGSERA